VRALDRKLARDLARLRGQVLTIALVVACGVACFVLLRNTWASLEASKSTYYDRQDFADVFAHLERAPLALRRRLEALPGVLRIDARVVEPLRLPMPGLAEPAAGVVVSLPEGGRGPNRVLLRSGRMPEPGRGDEVLVLEPFARAHGLGPGDRIGPVLRGSQRHFRVVGVALSPEYVLAVAPGEISVDDKRFAVLWMAREPLAAAVGLSGAFNDVAIRLRPGEHAEGVIEELDRLLAPYGGLGAHDRGKQASAVALEGELEQLASFAAAVPAIFLFVSAFLLSIVLTRLVHLERQQIACLKALGYSGREVGLHYLKFSALVAALGAAIGVAAGAWLGRGMVGLYAEFYHFPDARFRLEPGVAAAGVLVALGSAVAGSLGAVRGVARLPPAEAMRPAAPASYRRGLLERLGLDRALDTSGRMVLREIRRRPLRLLLSSVGIGFAVAILVVGRFLGDSFEGVLRLQFERAQREDVLVALTRPAPERALREIAHAPGVLTAEGARVVPVRFRAGARARDGAIHALEPGGQMRDLVDRAGRRVGLPPEGLVLSRKLAEVLGVGVGGEVGVEVREGERAAVVLRVAATVDDIMGLNAYAASPALRHALGESPSVSSLFLRVDGGHYDALVRRANDLPSVARVVRKQALVDHFRELQGRSMGLTVLTLTAFAVIIAIGVVYNNARVILSLRERDLASLRVLGFTRAEVSGVLLSELATQLALGTPLGLIAGTWMCHAVAATVDPEVYRMPVLISAETYVLAVAVTLAAGAASALLVRRRLDRLDLVGVLKERE
jgi:putative ABC transport system permease protein